MSELDDHVVHGGRVGAVHAGHGEHQPGLDLALAEPALLQRDDRRAVARLVAYGEVVEGEVEVPALGGRWRGQHHIRVPGRLIEIRVDADHEVESAQRAVEAVAVGGGEHRVGGDGDDSADPAVAGGVDLLGEGRHRQFALGLGVAADPAGPAAERKALAGGGGAGRPVGGGEREERAAGAVEVSGQHIEYVDQPVGEGSELDGAAADAAVYGGGGCGGELAGDRTDLLRVHVASGGDGFRRELPYGFPEFVDAFDLRRQRSEIGELLLEEDLGEGGEQQGVRSGPDRDVPVGELSGAGTARVDDGQRAAALAERLELAREVGRGAEAAVGVEGVGAEEQQMVGAVQVRDGDGDGVAEEQSAGDMLGHLVQGAGGEEIAGAQQREQYGG